MRARRAQSLKDALDQWIRSSGLQGPLARGRIIAAWQSMLGPQMEQHIGRTWIRGNKLYVTVTSSAWRQELHLRREEWRQRLNEEVGSDLIDEIVFR